MNWPQFSRLAQIFIFAGFLSIVGSIVYLVKFSGSNKNAQKFDPSEIFDPDNPEFAADSMSALYRQAITAQSDLEILKKEIRSVKTSVVKVADIKFTDAELKTSTGQLSDLGRRVLEQLSVISLYPMQPSQQPEIIYADSRNHYAASLYIMLLSANVPNVTRYVSFYSSLAYQSPDSAVTNNGTIDARTLSGTKEFAKQTLSMLSDNLTEQKVSSDSVYKDKIEKFGNLRNKYLKSRLDIRGQAISWGIIAFVSTAIFLYSIGAYFRQKRASDLPDKQSYLDANFLQSIKDSTWISVYMITVLLLIITIFILGLAGLLQENTLAALLGGIAGYVLNNNREALNNRLSTTAPTPATHAGAPAGQQPIDTPGGAAGGGDADKAV